MKGHVVFWVLLSVVLCSCGTTSNSSLPDANYGLDSGTNHPVDASSDYEIDTFLEQKSDLAWPSDNFISIDLTYAFVLAKESKLLLINVSDREFYYLGHIEGSILIPYHEIENRLAEIDSVRHVVVYCRRGVRSEIAYQVLHTNGYHQLWIMDGGMEAWLAKGYPTVE